MILNICFYLFSFFGLIAGCDLPLDPADDPKNIERPCSDFDMDCIREYFAKNSECEVSCESVPEPLFWNCTLNLANSNMTVELLNANLGGINGNVVEFYINKVTEKLVLAVEMQDLRFESPTSIFRYHRKRREYVERTDNVECNYGTTTLTVVFPYYNNLDLCSIEVFAYVDNPEPVYAIGPSMRTNLDCSEEKEYAKMLSSLPMDMQEALITQGKDFIINYIQYSICDFGL